MPVHLYISPWKWEQSEDFTGWARPNNGRILWDLRNYTQGSQRGGVAQGYGLFAYRSQQTLLDGMYLGQDPQRELSLLERSEIKTRLAVTLSETRLVRVLKELLIRHGDPTYENHWMPKRISRARGWRLGLGDLGDVISDAWSLDHPAWAATQAIRFVGYRKYRVLVAEGKLPIDMLRRWTGHDMLTYFGRMGDDLLPALVPPEYQDDGWLRPASTVTESFNKANSTTLGPDQTWTEWVGATKDSDGWTIVDNKAENLGGGGVVSGRADTGVSSSDHYCQAEVESFVGSTSFVGVVVRFASGDIADAWVIRYRNNSTLTWRSEKMLDGVLSNYSSVDEAAPGAGPLIMKATAQADDFLKFEIDGVQKDLVEMDALFTNLHGGIHAEAGNNRTRVDVWELTDLVAGDVTIAAVVMTATGAMPAATISAITTVGVVALTLSSRLLSVTLYSRSPAITLQSRNITLTGEVR